MKKTLASTAALMLTALCASTTPHGDAPLWLRMPSISPDGQEVAFSYRGDIYTVPLAGGKATRLTANSAYDANPVWSPDGTKIAFASDREGDLDVFVIPATGGNALRLTTATGAERPLAFVNDTTVMFTASGMLQPQSVQGPFTTAVYAVPTRQGRRPHLFSGIPMASAAVNADGRIAYQDRKGYEDVLRKHERSSSTADVWLLDNGKYSAVTTFNGPDQSPAWLADNQLAFISERGDDGTLNVWTIGTDGQNARQLTHFKDHPVRSLTASADGKNMAFSWNGELYSLSPDAEPQKIAVDIVADNYDGDLLRTLRTNGATAMAPSPDGDEVAFIMRGDVYVTSTKYKTTRRITNTPGQERVVDFAPDGRSLVYDAERNAGQWELYTATIADPAEKSLVYATEIVEKPLYSHPGHAAQQPKYSPDGKKVAFLEDRTTLQVLDLASKKVNNPLPSKYLYSYSDGDIDFAWSPDSRWFLTNYLGDGGWNNADIALVAADGSQIVDLTESGYSDSNPRWAMDGRAITYSTGKYGMRSHGSWGEQDDVMIMVLDPEAWDELNRTDEEAALAKKDEEKKGKKDEEKKGKKDEVGKGVKDKKEVKPLVFDLDNRQYRTRRLTTTSANMGDHWLNKEGSKLYYVAASADGSRNLMERDLRKDETKVLVKGLSGSFTPDAKGDNLFVNGRRGMSKVKLPDGKQEKIEFEAFYDRRPAQEREYIYNHMLEQVRQKFYDENLHGVDWTMYGDNYARFLPHINNNYDFAELLSETLGELNASHTGGRYRPLADRGELPVAALGAFFDDKYVGDGLLVTEVLPRGPMATKKAGIKAGDVILAIDGENIDAGADYNPLLQGKAGRPVRLRVQRPSGKVDNVTVKPIAAAEQSAMLYQRWVDRNAAIVDSLSDGRIGYVHVKGMDSPSFREVYSKLLGKYRNREAVVVDTRWNGGGWLHNDIALLLNGKEYVCYTPRGQYIGSDPFSQWTKPSAMLVNESNYSDAHGTPYVYQTLGIGPVVGAPVPGTMTAVWWENQVDPSLIFGIPEVTSRNPDGQVLENHQLTPDVIIYNNPADVQRGTDAQLAGAVATLLKKLPVANPQK